MKQTEMMEEMSGMQPWHNRIDYEVAHECGCESCGSKNVTFRGFQGFGQKHAFIVCHNCGECAAF